MATGSKWQVLAFMRDGLRDRHRRLAVHAVAAEASDGRKRLCCHYSVAFECAIHIRSAANNVLSLLWREPSVVRSSAPPSSFLLAGARSESGVVLAMARGGKKTETQTPLIKDPARYKVPAGRPGALPASPPAAPSAIQPLTH